MGIYKQIKSENYFADYYTVGGKRQRQSLGTTNKKVATIRYAGMLEKQKQARDLLSNPTPKIVDFEIRYNAFLSAERRPGTISCQKHALRVLKEINPNITYLSQITPLALQAVKEALIKRDKHAAGINRILRALKTMMRLAEKWQMIAPQQWQAVSRMRENSKRVEWHTEKELEQMLKLMPAWKTEILLGARAGLRRGEMANLKWQDIDYEHNQIWIAPDKTPKGRYVPLSPQLKKYLQSLKHGKDQYIVQVNGECARKNKYFFSAAYIKDAARAGFDSHLHKLRHTFASHLVQKGVDLYTVSKLLGHSSIKMTEIYSHLAPATLQAAVKLLP